MPSSLEPERMSDMQAQDVSAASLYMMAKLSATPQSPRNVLNVYTYLLSTIDRLSDEIDPSSPPDPPQPESYYLSEGGYVAQRQGLMKTEAHILRVLGFETHVALPYTLAINYLQALDVFGEANGDKGPSLSARTFAHLTTCLASPQLPYLTHQPAALASAAIYLGARETATKLPAEEWWQVFDVDREELGFLVVAMRSMPGFAQAEARKWARKRIPMTVDDVETVLADPTMLNGRD